MKLIGTQVPSPAKETAGDELEYPVNIPACVPNFQRKDTTFDKTERKK